MQNYSDSGTLYVRTQQSDMDFSSHEITKKYPNTQKICGKNVQS